MFGLDGSGVSPPATTTAHKPKVKSACSVGGVAHPKSKLTGYAGWVFRKFLGVLQEERWKGLYLYEYNLKIHKSDLFDI